MKNKKEKHRKMNMHITHKPGNIEFKQKLYESQEELYSNKNKHIMWTFTLHKKIYGGQAKSTKSKLDS